MAQPHDGYVIKISDNSRCALDQKSHTFWGESDDLAVGDGPHLGDPVSSEQCGDLTNHLTSTDLADFEAAAAPANCHLEPTAHHNPERSRFMVAEQHFAGANQSD